MSQPAPPSPTSLRLGRNLRQCRGSSSLAEPFDLRHAPKTAQDCKMPSHSQLSPRPRAIVLDTAALIAGTDSLYELGGLVDPTSGQPASLQHSNTPVRFFVTPDVAIEARDARARARLEGLERLGVIEQRAPSAEAVAAVAQFAKATGDYPVLSMTDLRVLALCWMLEVERNGTRSLNEAPEACGISEVRRARGIRFEDLERWEKEAEERQEQEGREDNGWTTVERVKPQPVKKTKKKKKKKKKKPVEGAQNGAEGKVESMDITGDAGEGCRQLHEEDITEGISVPPSDVLPGHSLPVKADSLEEGSGQALLVEQPVAIDGRLDAEVSEAVPVSEDVEEALCFEQLAAATCVPSVEESTVLGENGEADEDDGVGWINEQNLEEHLARDGGEETISEEDLMRVACVTTDFAMQNTMLQMGLKLLSVDGRRAIRQIRRFALRCHACSAVTRELQRKFCERCGNAAMHRVAFRVDKKGVARVFLNPKKKPFLRGTKYPIPMPRGGRHNKDLILREDQIDPVKQRRLDKQREKLNVDVLDPSSFYNAGARFNPHDRPLVVGYGRRNPNEVRATSKGKR